MPEHHLRSRWRPQHAHDFALWRESREKKRLYFIVFTLNNPRGTAPQCVCESCVAPRLSPRIHAWPEGMCTRKEEPLSARRRFTRSLSGSLGDFMTYTVPGSNLCWVMTGYLQSQRQLVEYESKTREGDHLATRMTSPCCRQGSIESPCTLLIPTTLSDTATTTGRPIKNPVAKLRSAGNTPAIETLW